MVSCFSFLGGYNGNHKYHAAAHGQGPNYEAGPLAEQKSTGHAVPCFFAGHKGIFYPVSRLCSRYLTKGPNCIIMLIQQDKERRLRMEWRFSSDAPIYAQLVAQIQNAIVSGTLPPGERLPSVRDLAAEAGVNPNTMQRAMAELEREGLVYSQRTAGRFVTEDHARIEQAKLQCAQHQIQNFLDGMARLGYGREETLRLVRQEMEGVG